MPARTIKEVHALLEAMSPKDPLMAIAWRDCLFYTACQRDCLDAFRKDTGCRYSPPRNPIDAMIDQATGHDQEFVLKFVRWFNANVWGEEEGRPVDAPARPDIPTGDTSPETFSGKPGGTYGR